MKTVSCVLIDMASPDSIRLHDPPTVGKVVSTRPHTNEVAVVIYVRVAVRSG